MIELTISCCEEWQWQGGEQAKCETSHARYVGCGADSGGRPTAGSS